MDSLRMLAGAAGTLRPPAVGLPVLGMIGGVCCGLGVVLVIIGAAGMQRARYSRGGVVFTGLLLLAAGIVLLAVFGGPLFDGGASTR